MQFEKIKNVHDCGLLNCLEETHLQAIKDKDSHRNINHKVLVEEHKRLMTALKNSKAYMMALYPFTNMWMKMVK